MIKKYNIILFFILSLCLFLSGSYLSFAESTNEGNTKIIINSPSSHFKAGENFKVIVEIKDNPGISAIQFTLSFDKNKMRCTNIFVGDVLSDSLNALNPNGKNGANLSAANTVNMNDDGTLGIFEFTALEDIEKFDYSITKAVITNSNGSDIDYKIEKTEYSDEPKDNESGNHSENGSKPDNLNNDDNVVSDYSDINNHWAKEYIEKATIKGLFKGYSDGSFKPDESITRAQFVTVLYRISGSPEVTNEVPFTDTSNIISEFKNAIAWAYSKGYVNGTSETTFSPDATLTRQEAMKILHYYNNGGISGMETLFIKGYEKSYSDIDSIASWAKPSIYWGVFNGLISGNPDGTMTPKGTATRAQLAKILISYIDKFM